jgi:alpha-1,3-glucosyltransferase
MITHHNGCQVPTVTSNCSALTVHLDQHHYTMSNSSSNNKNNNDLQYLFCYFILSVACKTLLFPSYRSTDFDVHRHWKALTRSSTLPLSDWYFDNEHVPDTVHTLDYPPSFAFFEYLLSNNVITNWLIRHDYLDGDCLALEASSASSSSTTTMLHGYQNPSTACIAFMRSTVIMSDVVLWIGAWMIASAAVVVTTSAVVTTNDKDDDKTQKWLMQTNNRKKWTIFGLIVANPGLLWLDSIHFQYNGFLLGILLLSLTCLIRGNHHHTTTSTSTSTTTILFHVWHIMAAVLFAFLLTLKHLYMTLSLWYFAYLLRRYCFVHQTIKTETSRIRTSGGGENDAASVVVFKPMRLLILGVATVTTLVGPFLPFFLLASSSNHRTATEQATRIFERLFPFGRGLVHDYWAGNVWAVYMAISKVIPKLKALEPSPKLVICLAVVALVPGAVVAYKAAVMASKVDYDAGSATTTTTTTLSGSSPSSSNFPSLKAHEQQQQQQANNTRLLMASDLLWSSFTYTTLAAFMIAYHVHEKAILTTLVPMTIWCCCCNHEAVDASQNDNHHLPSPPWLLLWRTMVFGLLGLFPLLFHPTEVLLKVFSFTAYLVILSSLSSQSSSPPPLQKRPPHRGCFQQQLVWLLIAVVLLILECIPLRYFGGYEFVPLALTSLTTAMGLLISFLQMSWRMMQLATVAM